MRACHVGVVHDPDVARLPAVAPYVSSVRRVQISRLPRKIGNPERLTEHAVFVVEERDRAVLHLVDHGRVGDRISVAFISSAAADERAADDLCRDRVERLDRHC